MKHDNSLPLVSIVVATYNRENFLAGALESMIAQDTAGEFHVEIVVVDNGSTDGTASVVSTLAESSPVPIRYVMERQEGVAHARNAGVRAAKGEWIAFFDDDQMTTENWLRYLFHAAEETGAQCLGGPVHLDLPEEILSQFNSAYRQTVLRESLRQDTQLKPRSYRRNEFPGTGNLLLARRVFDAVGLFDERMVWGGEDFDLAIRIKKAGYAMSYVPKAHVLHRISADRLTPVHMRRDAIQGGAMTAFLDHRYRGTLFACASGIARIGKSAVVTLPSLVIGKITNNRATEIACKMRLHRQEGYLRSLLTLLLPGLFPYEDLSRRWAFRQGR